MGSNKPKYLRPEDVAEHMRPFVDFDSQRLEVWGKRGYKRVYVGVQCPDCERWRRVAARRVRLGLSDTYKSTRCQVCAARKVQQENSPANEDWYDSRGYKRISISQLSEGDAVLAGAGRGLKMVEEHRLVAARCLRRPLERGEHVHHLDHVRDNNAPDNLLISSRAFHYALGQVEHWGEREALTAFTADGTPYQVRARVVLERVE